MNKTMNIRIMLITTILLILVSSLTGCFQGNVDKTNTSDKREDVGKSNQPVAQGNVSEPNLPDDNKPNYLITPNSAGDIRLGMTVADARKVFGGAKFEQYDSGEEGINIEVTRGKKNLMTLTTNQKNLVSDGQR